MPATLQATGVVEVSKAMTDVTISQSCKKQDSCKKGTLSEPTDTKIEICNLIGQVLLVKEFAAGGGCSVKLLNSIISQAEENIS